MLKIYISIIKKPLFAYLAENGFPFLFNLTSKYYPSEELALLAAAKTEISI